jgi:hypothetical protein
LNEPDVSLFYDNSEKMNEKFSVKIMKTKKIAAGRGVYTKYVEVNIL